MKVQVQNLASAASGAQAPLTVNYNNVGAYLSIQTLFTGGTVGTYSIEVNLGKIDIDPTSKTWQQQIIDPAGWTTLATPNTAGLTTALAPTQIQQPVMAFRINATTPGTGACTFKILQQGIG